MSDLSVALPGHATVTSLALPPDLTFEQWGALMGRLGLMGRGLSWWAADAYLHGERTWGEPAAQHAERLGIQPHTLLNLLWVARAFPPARRRAGVSWSHHAELSKLSPEEQDAWLDAIQEKGWTVPELRSEMRGLRAPVDGKISLAELGDAMAEEIAAYCHDYERAQQTVGADLPLLVHLWSAHRAWMAKRNRPLTTRRDSS